MKCQCNVTFLSALSSSHANCLLIVSWEWEMVNEPRNCLRFIAFSAGLWCGWPTDVVKETADVDFILCTNANVGRKDNHFLLEIVFKPVQCLGQDIITFFNNSSSWNENCLQFEIIKVPNLNRRSPPKPTIILIWMRQENERRVSASHSFRVSSNA